MCNANLMKEIALYIHIPWCIKKCPYCDFNSHRTTSTPPFTRYIDALIADFRRQILLFPHLQSLLLSSVFIGGGTPSLCPANEIGRLLVFIFNHLQCVNNIEITLEANPATVESQYFLDYPQSGINRLSIGAQSFCNTTLKRLGRIHCKEDNYRAIELAKKAGFTNVNLDLMYALPGQNVSMAMHDMQATLSCEVEHISYYQLTLEENTLFYRHPPCDMPTEGLAFDIAQQGEQLLTANGYKAYEVSAWTRHPESQCQHNLNYWNFGDYIGIGAGAHGKFTLPEKGQLHIFRTQHSNSPISYMKHIEALENQEELGTLADLPYNLFGSTKCANGMRITKILEDEILFEYMLNRLRLNTPFSTTECHHVTGLKEAHIENKMVAVMKKNLIEKIDNEEFGQHNSYQKTQLGHHFLNDLIWEFH